MKRGGEQGLVGLLVLLVLALILAKYFLNWSVFEAAQTPQGQNTVSYTSQIFHTIWAYVSIPFLFLWNNVLWPVLLLAWKSFQLFLNMGHVISQKL
jgi:hypothetical protein